MAAERLLADPAFTEILDRIVEDAASQALYVDDPAQREASRQMVLAITRIRGELKADAELPESVRDAEILAKSME